MNRSEVLGSVPYFADLPDEVIDTMAETTEMVEFQPGDPVIVEGSKSEEMYVVIQGQLVVTKAQGNRDVELARVGPGDVVGETALLAGSPRAASVTANTQSQVLKIPAETFERLLEDPRVSRRMFETVTNRLRSTESTLRHGERMAALGQMAAQLMHELNNPAAAVARSSSELARVSALLQAEIDRLVGAELLAPPDSPPPSKPLERSRLEEATADWLERNSIGEIWEITPALVREGWTPDALDELSARLEAETAPSVIAVLGLRAACRQIIEEVSIGASRISELVRVVKEYSFLDNAPIQEIVVTSGISDTLILLKHKLTDITVITDFAPDVMPVSAPGRDLNQVWTNLIDNAADAMPEGGTLRVAASNQEAGVVVTVTDTGTGIPEDVLPRIFDPFFTTKEPGKGTGLGLHTVHNIITRVGGWIEVESDRSGTTFIVCIPAVAD